MAPRSRLFEYTGAAQTFVVPRHMPGTLRVTCAGGQGSGGHPVGVVPYQGGEGGGISGTLNVDAGSSLYVVAGGGGGSLVFDGWGPALGGQGGKGIDNARVSDGAPYANTSGQTGGGGCASEVRSSSSIADRLIVAGGGGGGGNKTSLSGVTRAGRGGLGIADGGVALTGGSASGLAGTLSAAGAAGTHDTAVGGSPWPTETSFPPSAGSGGVGGDGGGLYIITNATTQDWLWADYSGGGGGGGYFGGGGGGRRWSGSVDSGGGGAGGSSWADTSVVADIEAGDLNGGHGWVLFEWEPIRRGPLLGLGRGLRSLHT